MKRNLANKCQICGSNFKVSHQYNVDCCRVCAAFFKIHLKNKRIKFECKCFPARFKTPLRLIDCEKCHLNKCLSVGMKEPEQAPEISGAYSKKEDSSKRSNLRENGSSNRKQQTNRSSTYLSELCPKNDSIGSYNGQLLITAKSEYSSEICPIEDSFRQQLINNESLEDQKVDLIKSLYSRGRSGMTKVPEIGTVLDRKWLKSRKSEIG
uniref:Nuclear receptor domain-containing protein n=1 Tax=Meloidogyne enterolobii TaxID=390850 RepID=A0A6V7URZ2_MELEN|nr:unnamed protein product [Meloidogyne enterolobii]